MPPEQRAVIPREPHAGQGQVGQGQVGQGEGHGQHSRLDAWERREESAFRLIPYFGLGISVLVSVILDDEWRSSLLSDLALAAFLAAWMLWMVTLHPGWASRRRLMAVYYTVLLAVTAILVVRAPWFGFFAYSGYLHAFLVLHGRWRLVGVAATSVIAATAQNGGLPDPTTPTMLIYLVVVSFNIGVGGAMSWFAMVSEEQTRRRKEMIAELAEANGRLEVAMQENAGLHAQLLTQAREAGVLDERARMAREIHDTLAQGLTGIITQLQAAEQARDHPRASDRHLGTAKRLARESLAEARRSVQALRPEPLAIARLPEALAEVVQRWSIDHGVAATVTTTGQAQPLHPDIEVTLLRVAQESLTNVAKHADATQVGLTLSYMEDLVMLDVRDDGHGFDPATVGDGQATSNGGGHGPSGGFGLTAMRQRVDRLAGTLTIESEPGLGTAISASVPASSPTNVRVSMPSAAAEVPGG